MGHFRDARHTATVDALVREAVSRAGLVALLDEVPRLEDIHTTGDDIQRLVAASGFQIETVNTRHSRARRFRNGAAFVGYLRRTVGDFYWPGSLFPQRERIISALVRALDAQLIGAPAYGIPFRTLWLQARVRHDTVPLA
ncbi:MAG: hypothetical protein ACRDF0_04505 [Candidatus Limnocylindria bacterium]